MSITDNNANQENSPMQDAFKKATATAKAADTSSVQSGSQPTQRAGLIGQSSRLKRAISRKSTGKNLSTFVKALQDILDSQDGADALKFVPVDRAGLGLPYSMILAYSTVPESNAVAVSAIVLEESGDPLAPRISNISGVNVEVEQVAGDIQTDRLWGIITEVLSGTFPQGAQLHEAGVVVIPRGFSHEDEPRLHNILFDVSNSNIGLLDRVLGGVEEKYSVSSWDSKTETVSARLDFLGSSVEGGTGEITRADVQITMKVTANQGNQQDEAWGQQSLMIAETTGYMDLIYTAPPAAQNSFGQPIAQAAPQQWGTQQAPSTQCYLPRFVMTGVTHGIDCVSLELQLQGLANAAILDEEHNWARAFLPNYNVKGSDMHDIGAVKYECPALADVEVDTKSADFTPSMLLQLLGVAVHPNLIYSMDIAEAGPMSWVQHILIDAASGNQKAIETLVAAADGMTNGNFSNLFQGTALFTGDVTRIHNGYYIDADGNQKDLREIDYLAMLNLQGSGDMQVVTDYVDTFTNTSVAEDARLQRRLTILRAQLGEQNVHVTGYSRRIDFTSDFILTLAKAMAAAGANVRPEGIYQDMTTGTRPTTNYQRFASQGNQHSGMFNQQTQFGGRGNGYQTNQIRTKW
jgi:hypothetical protein